MNSNNPYSSDFSYKKYSLEQLDNWVNDALNCEDLTPEDIHDTIVKCVDESVKYHKKYYTKSVELLSLLKGNRPVDFGDEGNITLGGTSDWNDFWGTDYTSGAERYPAAYVYTEEEMNAMCDKAASDDEKQRCREYNLRESEYYDKRAQLDISSGNDSKVNYESGWIYESPDGGKTVTKRKVGSMEKVVVKEDKVKKWVLPVEEVRDEDTGEDEYCIAFPDDLLEAANLKEGDNIEWVDQGDGSYKLRKIVQPLRMDEC